MHWFGWFNTYWALIIPAAFNAYSIFLLRQYIITIPNDILDAARLSGCSEFGLFWRMILPLSKPAIAAIALLNAVWTWNEFLWPTLMIKNQDWYTVQMVLGSGGVGPGGPGPIGAAFITLVTLPLIIFTLITQKYLLKGFGGFGYTNR
jgi:ABC-type glycerol-3-phosphate transport system permease component